MRYEITEAVPEGIIPIRHGLGTFEVVVRCERADGTPIGHLAAVPITADEVEVAVVAETAVVVVEAS